MAKFDQQPVQIDGRREDFIAQPGFGRHFPEVAARRGKICVNSQGGERESPFLGEGLGEAGQTTDLQFVFYVPDAPHPGPLPIGWGEGGRRAARAAKAVAGLAGGLAGWQRKRRLTHRSGEINFEHNRILAYRRDTAGSRGGIKIHTPNIFMKKSWLYLWFTLATFSALSAGMAATILFPIVVNGRWGFVNGAGETVINPQFDRAEVFAEGLAPVRLGHWGYVDAAGKLAINPQFDKADGFSEGLAAVKLGGGGGNPFVPFDPRPFSPFGGGGRYGFINSEGKYIINPQFDDAGNFSDGLAAVKMGKWGFVDKTGKIVINPQFDEANAFSEGLAVIKLSGRFGYTDKNGQLVINPQFERAQAFSEGLAGIRMGGRWGFVDKTGKTSINAQFDEVGPFVKGLAPARQSKRWGYINPAGNFIINPQFDDAAAFSEGLAAVRQSGRWGYVDASGKIMINPQFDEAAGFTNHLARVKTGGRFGYINPDGKYIYNPTN